MNQETTTRFAPVRLGIVGLGQFGRVHVLTAVGVGESELVALVDDDQRRVRHFSEILPQIPCWTNLERALAESDAEAWIVATSTASHVPLTQMLLAAGKTVLLEKPMADEFATAQLLAPLVHTDSRNLMLGHVVLFNTEFRQLLTEVRRRGPIAYLDCVRHRPATTLDRFPGESPFSLTMVHDLYMALVLMDRAEPASIRAQTHRTADGRCDLALAQFQWPTGTVASFCASFMTPPGMPVDGFDRMELFGAGWAARLHPNPRPIQVWDDCARWPLALEILTEEGFTTGMLAEQLRCFCRVVRGHQPVPVGATYDDGLRLLRWIGRLQDAVG